MALTDALQNNFRTAFIEEIKSAFDPISKDNYYLFFGKTSPWTDETTPPTVIDGVASHNEALRNSLFSIRIDERNTSLVIPRFDWSSGTAYDEYDDTIDLHDVGSLKKYYVLVDADRVYKCISNNNGRTSTQKPTTTDTHIFTTSDGYQWKFLYKLTETQKDFLTDEYIPLSIANKGGDAVEELQYQVQTKAVDGEIYRISVTDNDGVYSNAIRSGNNLEPDASVPVGVTAIDFKTGGLVSSTSNAYQGYMVHVHGGRGPEIGQISKVVSSSEIVGEGVVRLQLEDAFTQKVFGQNETGVKSKVSILPEVIIHGDGTDASAFLSVNDSKKAQSISILNGGRDYKSAYVEFPTTVTGTPPTGRVFIGPNGGHGSNVIDEFDASRIMIRILNENIENQVEIINVNDFRQFGIIKNPILNDNSLRVAGDEYDRKTRINIRKPYGVTGEWTDALSASPTFVAGDYVMGVETLAVSEIDTWTLGADRTTGTLILKNPSANFGLPATVQEHVRINFGSSGESGDFQQFETVTQYNSVAGLTATGVVKSWDSTARELVVRLGSTGSFEPVPFISTDTTNPVIGQSSNAYAYDYKNLEDEAGEELITFGLTSGTLKIIDNTPKIARIASGINTFIDTDTRPIYRMSTTLEIADSGGGLNSTSFTLDDGITQEVDGLNVTANVASWTAISGTTGSLVVTNIIGGFTSGLTLASPDASNWNINTITEPDLVVGSGEVLYIQNIRPIERQAKQREEFRISIGF